MFSCFSCNLEYKSSQLYLAAYNPLTLEALSMPGVPGFMIFWLRLVIKVANVLSLPKRELSLVCPSATCEFVLFLMSVFSTSVILSLSF